MNIVLFTHPSFLDSESMPRFANFIEQGMGSRGHTVTIWTASACFYKLPAPKSLKKWLGYVDQFLVFPVQIWLKLAKCPRETLFVFADQALGPWVPLVENRPHVIHAHDFLALRSSLGEFPQNPTAWSGRQYQAMIRRGFSHGRHFISVSKKTQSDLHGFLDKAPLSSDVVYNGLNFPFRAMAAQESLDALAPLGIAIPAAGFLLHIGGNQWYKNRVGVLEIYEAYVQECGADPLPLWMVGPPPSEAMEAIASRCAGKGEIKFLSGLSGEQLCAAYSLASLFIFPSIAEGFGWPIAEAMACGCLLVTTNEDPMTEVGGSAAFYIPKKPDREASDWANTSALEIINILDLPQKEKQKRRDSGFEQVRQFDAEKAIAGYETVYQRILAGKPR